MATVLTSEQAEILNAIVEARSSAQPILDAAAAIREAKATPRREVVTFDGGHVVTDNEPVVTFKNGRVVTYANKHAAYKAWYQKLGITAEQASACADEAVARLRPKPTTLSAAEVHFCKKLGVDPADALAKWNER